MTVNENMTVKERVEAIRERMAESAVRAGRQASEIKLLAVTKTRTPEEILEAVPYVDGLGENRIQEAAFKKQGAVLNGAAPFPDGTQWRLIGHLQSNKARKALALFDSIDSIDSLDIARAVDRIAGEDGGTVPVLIEVNTSGEGSKTGVAPEAFPALLDCVLNCPRLRLDGLMTIGPLLPAASPDYEVRVRGAFAQLRGLAEDARVRSGLPLPVLSMGMSGDFELAIAEGSTMVRIGTSLFGPRQAKGVAP